MLLVMPASPSSPEDYIRKASAEFADLSKSIDTISAGIVTFPKSPELYLELGKYLRMLSSFKNHSEALNQAIVAYQAATALDWSKGWYDLSKVLEDDHQYEAALAICRKELDYLDTLKPGRDYVANPSAPFFQKLRMVKSIEQHRAAMKRFAEAKEFKQALTECRTAAVLWKLAYTLTKD